MIQGKHTECLLWLIVRMKGVLWEHPQTKVINTISNAIKLTVVLIL